MSSSWQIKTLGEVCDFLNGLWKGKKPPYIQVGVIRNTNFTKEGRLDESNIAYLDVETRQFEKRQLQFGDIIIEKSGGGPKQPVGRVIVFERNDGRFSFSNFTSVIRVKEQSGLNYQYLHKYLYFLHSSGITVRMQKHSTGIRNLQMKEYKEVNIPLPPLPEQRRIVAILDKAFVAIEKAKGDVEKNLQNAQELFDSYLQNIFEDNENELEEKRFDEICVLQRGFDLPTRLRNKGEYPLVSSNGITDSIDLWKVQAPGVVTGRSGTIGNLHYIEKDFWPLNTSLYIKDFHGNDERCVYYFLKKFNLNKHSSGTGVPTLNRNHVHGINVKFPKALSYQKNIVRKLDVLVSNQEKLQSLYIKKLSALDELKQSLLKKAFAGEL